MIERMLYGAEADRQEIKQKIISAKRKYYLEGVFLLGCGLYAAGEPYIVPWMSEGVNILIARQAPSYISDLWNTVNQSVEQSFILSTHKQQIADGLSYLSRGLAGVAAVSIVKRMRHIIRDVHELQQEKRNLTQAITSYRLSLQIR